MSITTRVKSKAEATKLQREQAAQRVISHFGLCLPQSRVLCFLDDQNPSSLKQAFGAANRGLSGTVKDGDDLSIWPGYVQKYMHADGASLIDQLIYLYGSTCSDEVALRMTLAHELQHAIQHDRLRK